MMLKQAAKAVLAAAPIAGALAIAPAPAAQAHTTCQTQGADIACVSRSHHQIKWCDRERDGNRVYAQFRVEFFTITTGSDPDGSGPRCGIRRDKWQIWNYRVCESSPKSTTCSRWKRA